MSKLEDIMPDRGSIGISYWFNRWDVNSKKCHNIEPGGAFKLYPPSFTAIAKYYEPNMIAMKIMYPGHAVLMPQFHKFMFRENVDNLVGYIVSLDE